MREGARRLYGECAKIPTGGSVAQWIAHWTSRGLKGFKGSGFESRRSRVFSFPVLLFFYKFPPPPTPFGRKSFPRTPPSLYLTAAGIRYAGLALSRQRRSPGPPPAVPGGLENAGSGRRKSPPTEPAASALPGEASSPPARTRSRTRPCSPPPAPPPSGSGRRALLSFPGRAALTQREKGSALLSRPCRPQAAGEGLCSPVPAPSGSRRALRSRSPGPSPARAVRTENQPRGAATLPGQSAENNFT
ncbi:basic proline-rich protein-like [Prinia subflava]|uniref:basic proline-rich protein-like n=1 Tax=Prinia subflava TaxID=208062 RepID=UPI002FE07B9E